MSHNLEKPEIWVEKIKSKYSIESFKIEGDKLLTLVGEMLPLCAPLSIELEDDIIRFLAFWAMLTPEQRNSRFFEGVVRRILANTDWPASKRLNFLFKHIVGRPVPSVEPDFGPNFIPPLPATRS